jgi:hypothetical protein
MLRYVATPFEGILVPEYFSAAVSNFFSIVSQSITRTLRFLLVFMWIQEYSRIAVSSLRKEKLAIRQLCHAHILTNVNI